MWRAVVRWGQHKARVPHPSLLWSEDDRSLVKQALDGILQHVQVMDINSEVFAKEVEPTGLLSVERMLERYRHATITVKGGSGLNGRSSSSPRSVGSGGGGMKIVQEPFADSAILNGKLDWQWDIHEW